MSTIAKNGNSYAYVAPPGVNSAQTALDKLSARTGKALADPTVSLTTQSQALKNFAANATNLLKPQVGLEYQRGLAKADDLTLASVNAYRAAATRLLGAAGQAVGASASATGALSSNSIADILKDTLANTASDDAPDLITQIYKSSTLTNKAVHINSGYNADPKADPFDRDTRTLFGARGGVSLDVSRVALAARAVKIPTATTLGSKTTAGTFDATTLVKSGAATNRNTGYQIAAKALGKGNATIALDTRDPNGNDNRLSAVTVDTGAGSDVLWVAGNAHTVAHLGAGDDFGIAEGNAILYGGAGSDTLFGNTVSGDAGDDVLFSTGFASGGDGKDTITLFKLAGAGEGRLTAYGGAGDDLVVADAEADVDGGDGNDSIILRQGGSARGGAGNDVITAEKDADVDGGDGDDDIQLIAGGSVDGGAGNDTITASKFATVTGGKGNDKIALTGGGVVNFAKGDGQDSVLFGTPVSGDTTGAGRNNEINLDVPFSAVTLSTAASGFVLTVNGTTDRLDVTVLPGAATLSINFRSGGQVQTVSYKDGVATLGAARVG